MASAPGAGAVSPDDGALPASGRRLSSMKKEHLIPGAILVGFALLALGVYSGLKAQSVGAPSSAETLAEAPRSAAPPPGVGPAPGAPTAPEVPASARAGALQASVERVVLAEKRAVFLPKCWEPMVAKQAEPAKARYAMQMVFDATGTEIGRGISELRGSESRPDVGRCLRELPIGLKIPAPGANVPVSVELTFP